MTWPTLASAKRQGVTATGVMTVVPPLALNVSVLALKVDTSVSNCPFDDGTTTMKR